MGVDRIQIVGGLSDRKMAGNKRYRITRADENGSPVQVTSFADSDEMAEAMMVTDPDTGKSLYDHDPVYRLSVQDVIANSPALMEEPTLAYRGAIPDNETMLKGMREDAARQAHDQYVEAFGGKDAIGKFNLAQMIMNPTDEQREGLAEIHESVTPARPLEDMLKEGGPIRWSIPTEDESKVVHSEEEIAESRMTEDGYIIELDR